MPGRLSTSRAIRAMSAEVENRSWHVTGSMILGAELAVITSGASSGTTRSSSGSRAKNLNRGGTVCSRSSTTAGGKVTRLFDSSTWHPPCRKRSRARVLPTSSPTWSRISSDASWTRWTSFGLSNWDTCENILCGLRHSRLLILPALLFQARRQGNQTQESKPEQYAKPVDK